MERAMLRISCMLLGNIGSYNVQSTSRTFILSTKTRRQLGSVAAVEVWRESLLNLGRSCCSG